MRLVKVIMSELKYHRPGKATPSRWVTTSEVRSKFGVDVISKMKESFNGPIEGVAIKDPPTTIKSKRAVSGRLQTQEWPGMRSLLAALPSMGQASPTLIRNLMQAIFSHAVETLGRDPMEETRQNSSIKRGHKGNEVAFQSVLKATLSTGSIALSTHRSRQSI